ncbi:glycoside hydrolase family 105 protein [Paenibacillus sp. WLX1005]|uniref:glycoside hydrolase family 88/105 protein n=1 Tax=Paenibacillus sp. WLX1005 TaxID=3243766 RepID=UPI003983E909
MTTYFDEPQSMYYRFGEDQSQVLKVLAERYIGANAQADFVYRAFQREGILQTSSGLYDLNLGERFPEVIKGQLVYAAGLVWGDEERNLDVLLRCYGPVRFFFNGALHYRSNVMDELEPDSTVKVSIDIKPGWNTLVLEMKYTPAGFGCQFGSDEGKVRILNVVAPFAERAGQAGWAYSVPFTPERPTTANSHSSSDDAIILVPESLDVFGHEQDNGLQWLPRQSWNEQEQALPPLERMYGRSVHQSVYAWTRINHTDPQSHSIRLHGQASGSLHIWLQQQEVVRLEQAGNFDVTVPVHFGFNDLLVCSTCSDTDTPWQFTVQAHNKEQNVQPELPWRIRGTGDENWLYAGPFASGAEPAPEWMNRMDRLYDGGGNSVSQHTYWRLDRPGTWIRPHYENAMLSNKWTVGQVTNYGRWDYPLGVTIYGLLQAGDYLNRPDIVRYAAEHVQSCTRMYDYSLWDREQYGFPAINQQLVMLKMLDNCGSFGSAMLQAYGACEEPTFLPIAERIADFILTRLERQPDGAFYRKCIGEYAANTMWADDLYMSTPFLVRYARLTGRTEALDEAARQFLLFRKYLYMPEQQIMSHVYDFKYNQATQVPWGRGNGWTLFSLSEVLEALPKQHAQRGELIAFFNDLCAGYAALQADSGLWHQVLNEPDTYEEASCTAMFAYGFARGVRFGWLHDPGIYTAAAQKAWNGLTRHAIDRQGNVHGVCSGSRYAFTPEYYDRDLRTVTNDNHGIGIMMLAGTEVARMKQHLGQTIGVSDGILS